MTLSRSLLIGLIVSAALNVFLIGGVAGVAWVRRTTPAPALAQPPAPLRLAPEAASSQNPPSAPAAEIPSAPPRSPPLGPVAKPAPAQGDQTVRPPLWTAGQDLSPESRQALRRALHEANLRNRPITLQARSERQAALQAFKSKAYDAAEVGRRLAAARALDVQARGNVEAALASYAATLSPDERAVLADGLARVYAPRPKSPRIDNP